MSALRTAAPFSAALVLLASALVIPAPRANAEPVLRLLTFQAPPLVDVKEEGARPTGISMSLVERLFEQANINYELILFPPKRALHTASAVANTCALPIERSQEREPHLEWLGPVAISRHALYSHPDHPIPLSTLEDARPYRISSSIGSGVGDYLSALGFKVELTRDSSHAYLMNLRGRTQLWVADILAAPIITDHPDYELGNRELVIYTTQRYMGCHPDTDPSLLKRLRETLTTMHDRDEVRDMLKLEDL